MLFESYFVSLLQVLKFVSVYLEKMWRPWAGEQDAGREEENQNAMEEDGIIEKRTRQHLSLDAKNIILNVYNFIKNSSGEGGAVRKTAEMTGVAYTSIRDIVLRGVEKRKRRCDRGTFRVVKENDAQLVRRTLYNLYENKVLSTLEMLHEKLANDFGISFSISTLRRILMKIGFRYRTIDKRQVLKESSRISEWRYKYVKEIREVRAKNHPIYYLDETWYDTHDTAKKGWSDSSNCCIVNLPPTRGKRIIILHAGSEDGFVPDALLLSAKNVKSSCLDYHEDMSGELFEKWFRETLIPKLKPNSVIVMDNAKYHSREEKRIPNASSRKEEIMEFLRENDTYYEDSYTKVQLLEVLRTKEFRKSYRIDKIAIENGYRVIKLPPYHCELNPIEMIWSELKAHIRRNNTNPKNSDGMLKIIEEEVAKIGATSWKNCIRHVTEIEELYFHKFQPEIVINIGEVSTDESDFSSDLTI